MKLFTYLNFGGNCREAFTFYEKHLGGKVLAMMNHGEQPNAASVPPEWKEAVLYARMRIGETDLMGSDVPGGNFQPMRSAYLYFSADSSEEADRVYGVLSQAAQIIMPMEETFFALRFGMLRDKFGVLWMIIHERPM